MSTPGSEVSACGVPWGICPDHGRSVRSSADTSWCDTPGCPRTWNYDRLATPCPEPVWAELTFAEGPTARFCEGHTRDAHMYVRPTAPTIRRMDGQPFVGAPYDEGAPYEAHESARARRPDPGPYARAVVDALRAAGVLVTDCTTTATPAIVLALDLDQCCAAGYRHSIHLDWGSTCGWRYGPTDPTDPDRFLWVAYLGDNLLPTPAAMAELVDRHILHTTWRDEPEYRAHTAEDDLAGQLDRAAHPHD